jgi:hypothetical protein
MVHPDEGTIHAWLDGALAPDEALRVEAHVQGCETCGAAIAEARGFIAASSRILSALDDVPSAVIPSEGHTQPTVAHIRRADQQRKRRLRQTFAMAATLLLMLSGGLFVVNQTSRNAATFADSAGLGDRIASAAKQESVDSSVNVAANTPPAMVSADSAVGLSAPTTGAASTAREQSARDLAARGATENSTSRAATEKLRTGGAQADVAATVAAAPPPVVAPPATGAEARTTGTVGNVAGTVAGNAATGIGTGVGTQQVAQRDLRVDSSRTDMQSRGAQRAASAPVPTTPAPASPIVALTGCYQLTSQADLSVADSRRDEAMVVAALPARIRLTDSIVTDVNGERRYLARSIVASGTPVRRFAWSASANGALRLFVGDSANAPAVRVSADSAASGVAGQLRRIACR